MDYFFKCNCSIINKHIIVLDKRMEGNVLHQSKGISNYACENLKKHILTSIILFSNGKCFVKRVYRDTGISELLVDLIFDTSLTIDEHMVDEYKAKLHDVDIKLNQIKSTEQMLALISSTSLHTDGDEAIRANHRLRHAESDLAVEAFEAWLRRHINESMTNTVRSIVPTLFSHYVGSVPVDDMAKFDAWMDQQERFMHGMTNMLDKLAGRKTGVSDDMAAMIHELMLYADADKMTTADQYRQIIQAAVDMYPEPVSDDDCGSTSMVDDGNSNEGRVDMLCDDQDGLMTPNMSKTEVKEMVEVVSTNYFMSED
jgi:hypothetical protein